MQNETVDITYDEQRDLDARAMIERAQLTYIDYTEVSYEEKRNQLVREADRLASIRFGLEAGQFLASLGIKFAYKVPHITKYAIKFRE